MLRILGTLRDDLCTFMMSRSILLNMRNVSDKLCRENQYTSFFFRKSCNFYEEIYKKYGRVGQATDDNIIRRMRFACGVTKAADRHSEYVILTAFPQQQCLCERVSMSRYTYIACLFIDTIASNVVKFVLLKSGRSFSIVTKLWAGKSGIG